MRSDRELLEALLGKSRKASRVRESDDAYQSESLTEMVYYTPEQLRAALGITAHQAEVLSAFFELHRRLLQPVARPSLTTPDAVADLMRAQAETDHECFWCLPLDPRSRLIGEPLKVSQGDVDSTDAGPRLFMRAALRCGATTCVAVHNHPSGEPDPSSADVAVTRRLLKAGRAVDVQLVDHVIIARGGRFYSLRRNNSVLFSSAE